VLSVNERITQHDCHACEASLRFARSPSVDAGAVTGIGRRTFLVQSGIVAAIAALSACGLGGGDITAPSVPANSTIAVSDYASLANVGGVAVVTLGSAPVAIVRTGTSSFIALSRICPHQGGTVQLSGSNFVCPNHGATFNTSGQWIGGQRTSSLHAYATTYDGATGTLTIN
jgi:nitrite reductase/ring-hydroxylating ferredoxin subunit